MEITYRERKSAKQGYGLDILVNDENPYVRAAEAKQMKTNRKSRE